MSLGTVIVDLDVPDKLLIMYFALKYLKKKN
jgi:hypothetical protein